MSAASPSSRLFSEGVALFPILPCPACGAARLLTCESLSTIDWQGLVSQSFSLLDFLLSSPVQGYVCGRSAGSPRGAAVWGLILPPASDEHCCGCCCCCSEGDKMDRHFACICVVDGFGTGRVCQMDPGANAKAEWLSCSMNSMSRQKSRTNLILYYI